MNWKIINVMLLLVIILICSFISYGIGYNKSTDPTQDIHAFVELEDYLKASGEKHNINYLRLLFHYGNNDCVIVNKHFFDDDYWYYRIYHTVDLDLGEGRRANTFHVRYEADHTKGITYPLLSYEIIGGEHDGWWSWIDSNKNLTISLYDSTIS